MKQNTPFRRLALAVGLSLGLASANALAQVTIEVGGAGTIADSTLTSGSVPGQVGATWSTPGAEAGGGNTAETFLSSPDVTVGTTGPVTVSFDHRYFIEAGWDGGAIFVSKNGAAATYVDTTAYISGQDYVGDTTANPGTAWTGGEDVFYGKSSGYDNTASSNLVTSVFNLGNFTAGDTVSVEFRYIADEGFSEAGIDWEIASVTLADTATILDVDFITDGASGFAVTSNATINGGEWTYPNAINHFEINADTLAADRYAPVSAPSVIDLNDADISVSILTGTLGVGDSFQLFDLSGGTTLTGSVGTLTLPPGQWDTSSFETDGTITCLDPASPLIYEGFNDLDPTLNGNTPGLGLTGTWSAECLVEDRSLTYGRLAYSGGRAVPNMAITNGVINNEIGTGNTLLDAGLLDDGATLWFSTLIVKAPDTSDNTNERKIYFTLGTGGADAFDRIGGNTGSGWGIVVNRSNNGVSDQIRGWNNGSDGAGGAFGSSNSSWVPEGETLLAVGKITWGQFGTTQDVFEVYVPDLDLNLGSPVATLSADFDQKGDSNAANVFDTISCAAQRGGPNQNAVPEFDEIRFAATSAGVLPLDLAAPVLVNTDNASGSPIARLATFDEDIYAGSGDIRIVNETTPGTTTIAATDSQVTFFENTLTITPTVPLGGGDTYHIEIDADAVLDYNGNAFAGIADPNTWKFTVDGAPPTVASFGDNTHPLPILTNTSTLVYTVTFDEAMDASTISNTDFGPTAGSVSATVDSVTATSPTTFDIGVTTGGTPGTLQLEIVSGAVISDVNGNNLVVGAGIPSDNTLTVNAPTPNSGSAVVDFQGTIASEQHPTYPGEARYFHVSVNPDNPGTGAYANTIPGTNTPDTPYVRNYTGPVEAYKFLGGTNNSISGVAFQGGTSGRFVYTTEDPSFDGFGQQQCRLWTTDPGADLMIGMTTGATGFVGGNFGYRSFGGAECTVDISGLASGSLHIYYGSFSATPSVNIIMRDTDNVGADIVINDAHSIADGGNGDAANRTEYYLAEIDFVTDGVYDVIIFEWLANGSDYTGNGRGLGAVLTGPDFPPPSGGPYADWAVSNGLTEGVNDAPGDDADSDPSVKGAGGLNNLGEFGLGGDPLDGNDDGALLNAYSSDVVVGGDPEGVLTILVRDAAAGGFAASGNDQASTGDGITYTVSAESTLPVAGGVAVSVSGTTVTDGLPPAPAGYTYVSFYIEGAEGYFQVTVEEAP